MDKVKIRYNNWDAVPISKYIKISNICTDDAIDDTAKSVGVISELSDVDESVIWDLPMSEINKLVNDIKWVNKFDFKKRWTIKKLNVGDKKCHIDYDLQNMTISQYVDFQTAWRIKDSQEKLVPVLSCFIIPDGCKYNDGYDIVEFRKEIEDNIPITVANSVCFFFLKKLRNSIKSSLICSQMMLKALRKTMKNKEMRDQMIEAEKNLLQMQNLYSVGCI